jgi:hypothetical protein
LQRLNIKPLRSLADDMVLQTNVMSYGGTGKTISVAPSSNGAAKKDACGCGEACCAEARRASEDSVPDFTKMTSAQKVAYHKARWDRILG